MYDICTTQAVEGSRIDIYPFKEHIKVGGITPILKRKPTFVVGLYVQVEEHTLPKINFAKKGKK